MPLNYEDAIYIPNGDPRTLGSMMTSLYAPGDLGKRTQFNFGTAAAPIWVTMQLVKYKTGITFAVGEVLWWDDIDDKIVTNVSNGGVVAGVAPYIAVAASYGWCYKAGNVAVKYVDAPTVAPSTAGLLAVASATNGRADCITTITALVPIGRTLGAQDATSKLASTMLNIFDVSN
jgi:hypothetical protein